jgi:hypothetical protein
MDFKDYITCIAQINHFLRAAYRELTWFHCYSILFGALAHPILLFPICCCLDIGFSWVSPHVQRQKPETNSEATQHLGQEIF